MDASLTNCDRSRSASEKILEAAAVVVATPRYIAAQDKPKGNCHAAIRGERVRRDPPSTEPSFVMLTSILSNDSEAHSKCHGPERTERFRLYFSGMALNQLVAPGESYEFGEGVGTQPEEEYRVFWNCKGFQSSTITVRVTPKQSVLDARMQKSKFSRVGSMPKRRREKQKGEFL